MLVKQDLHGVNGGVMCEIGHDLTRAPRVQMSPMFLPFLRFIGVIRGGQHG